MVKQFRSNATSKTYYMFITFILCLLVIFIYIICSKLKISYFDFSLNYLITSKNRIRKESTLFIKNSKKCNPILFKSDQYSVKIENIIYPKSIPLHLNTSINFGCLRKSKRIKRILAWNSFFGDFSYNKAFEDNSCPVNNCVLTSNKNLINDSDLVIFHMMQQIAKFPDYRPSFQRWIFLVYESPINSGDFKIYNRLFNLSSTYKIISNFSGFYENFSFMQWKYNPSFNISYDFYNTKKKFAVALISNCNAKSGRLEYIMEMRKYVSVDVFGNCGKTCPTNFSDSSPGNCKDILGREYKFFFAFENSICQDYITEKFFDLLKYNIIPVVLGGGNYEHYVSF